MIHDDVGNCGLCGVKQLHAAAYHTHIVTSQIVIPAYSEQVYSVLYSGLWTLHTGLGSTRLDSTRLIQPGKHDSQSVHPPPVPDSLL